MFRLNQKALLIIGPTSVSFNIIKGPSTHFTLDLMQSFFIMKTLAFLSLQKSKHHIQ